MIFLKGDINPPHDSSFENYKCQVKYFPSQRETRLLFRSTNKDFAKYISF